MTTSTKLHIAAYSAAALLIIIFVAGWIQEHIATERAQAKADAQQMLIDNAEKRMKQRETDFQAGMDSLRAQIAAVKTPEQAIRYIHDAVPALANVQQARDLPATIPNAPVPQGMRTVTVHDDDAIVPSAQLLESAKLVNACQQDKAGFAKCQGDAVDVQGKLAATEKERDAWKVAAKGGTKWQRFGKAVKCVAFSGGGAGLGAMLGGKSGAVIGGGAGSAACFIW